MICLDIVLVSRSSSIIFSTQNSYLNSRFWCGSSDKAATTEHTMIIPKIWGSDTNCKSQKQRLWSWNESNMNQSAESNDSIISLKQEYQEHSRTNQEHEEHNCI